MGCFWVCVCVWSAHPPDYCWALPVRPAGTAGGYGAGFDSAAPSSLPLGWSPFPPFSAPLAGPPSPLSWVASRPVLAGSCLFPSWRNTPTSWNASFSSHFPVPSPRPPPPWPVPDPFLFPFFSPPRRSLFSLALRNSRFGTVSEGLLRSRSGASGSGSRRPVPPTPPAQQSICAATHWLRAATTGLETRRIAKLSGQQPTHVNRLYEGSRFNSPGKLFSRASL